MSHPQVAPYGTWKSPLSADVFAAGIVSLEEVVVNVGARPVVVARQGLR